MKTLKQAHSLDLQGFEVTSGHLAHHERMFVPSHGHFVSSSGNHRTNSTIPSESGIAALCHDLN